MSAVRTVGDHSAVRPSPLPAGCPLPTLGCRARVRSGHTPAQAPGWGSRRDPVSEERRFPPTRSFSPEMSPRRAGPAFPQSVVRPLRWSRAPQTGCALWDAQGCPGSSPDHSAVGPWLWTGDEEREVPVGVPGGWRGSCVCTSGSRALCPAPRPLRTVVAVPDTPGATCPQWEFLTGDTGGKRCPADLPPPPPQGPGLGRVPVHPQAAGFPLLQVCPFYIFMVTFSVILH